MQAGMTGALPRVLLVHPPTPVLDIMAPELTCTPGWMPPMGILSLGTYARDRAGVDVRFLDLQTAADPMAMLRAAMADQPDVVGVTCMLFTYLDVLRIARAAREALPGVHVCMGGAHATVYPEQTARVPEVDSVVCGEGEVTFECLLEALRDGADLAGMPGLAVRGSSGKVEVGPSRDLIEDIDSLPIPDRTVFGPEDYSWVMDKGRRSTVLFAGRGCPFRCSFCFNPNKKVRIHSPTRVIEEMQRCIAEGYTVLHFYDETLNLTRERTLALAQAIQEANLGVKWTCRCRCDVMDDEIAQALVAAGCERINFGVEAGTDEILKVYRKQITVAQAEHAVRTAAKAGIEVLAYFMFGAPYETLEQCRKTLDLACSLPLAAAQFMIFLPIPGTDLYDRALAEGGFEEDYVRRWYENPTGPFKLRVWKTTLDEAALAEFLRNAYRRFYMRPSFILRQALQVRSFKDLAVRARAALALAAYSLRRRRSRERA